MPARREPAGPTGNGSRSRTLARGGLARETADDDVEKDETAASSTTGDGAATPGKPGLGQPRCGRRAVPWTTSGTEGRPPRHPLRHGGWRRSGEGEVGCSPWAAGGKGAGRLPNLKVGRVREGMREASEADFGSAADRRCRRPAGHFRN